MNLGAADLNPPFGVPSGSSLQAACTDCLKVSWKPPVEAGAVRGDGGTAQIDPSRPITTLACSQWFAHALRGDLSLVGRLLHPNMP